MAAVNIPKGDSTPTAARPPGGMPGGANMEFVSALLQFCFASVSMMLGNKQAVRSLPLPCTLVIIQAFGTLLLLQMPYCRAQMQAFKLETAKQWMPIACIFTLMLFTSLKSFVYAGVATVLIFRNIGAMSMPLIL